MKHFFLGDLRNTDGSAWECCPREFLRRGLAALEAAAGLRLIAAFEQEFVYTGIEDHPCLQPGRLASPGRARRGVRGGLARAPAWCPTSFLPGIRQPAVRG